MKIAMLALAHSIHSVRWANALAERGHEVHLISSTKNIDPLLEEVRYHRLPFAAPLGYFLNTRALRRLLADIEPDVLNTHFASGYGTLARLTKFTPNVLSVWGSDVFDFPKKSAAHKRLIQSNLNAAQWICSTSNVMADEVRSLVETKRLSTIAFGIDLEAFTPALASSTSDEIVIGTVKTMKPKYGVDVLIRAFAVLRARVRSEQPELADKLKLRLVGGGPDLKSLQALAAELGIGDVTTFTGAIPHEMVPTNLQKLDVYVALSRLDSESFGVAVLEASACELPVVVSDAGGLPEVVEQSRTGFIVPREDPDSAARALFTLVTNPGLRNTMGAAGRKHVEKNYDWQDNVSSMEQLLQQVAVKSPFHTH